MEMKELLNDINKIHEYFIKKNTNIDTEKHVLLSSMKLAEEVGELYEQILGHYSHGRKEKLEKYSPENLEHEVADVIFSTLVIARLLDIDVEKSMVNKMIHIKNRFGIE